MRLIRFILLLNFSTFLVAETLEVSVKDFTSQESIKNARITITELSLQETENSEGLIIFDIPVGTYSLFVEADNYIATEETVELTEGGSSIILYLETEVVLDTIVIEGEENQNTDEELRLAGVKMEDLPFEAANPFAFGETLAGTIQLAPPHLVAGSQLLRSSWFSSTYGTSGSWNRYFYDYLRLPSALRLSGDSVVKHATVNTKMVRGVRSSLGFSSGLIGSSLGTTHIAQVYTVPTPIEMLKNTRLSSYQLEQLKRRKINAILAEEKRLAEEERQQKLSALPPELQDKNNDGYSDLSNQKLYDTDRDGYPDVVGNIFLDRNQDGFSDLADVPLYDSDLDGKVDFYGDIFLDEDHDGFSDLAGVELFDRDNDGVYDIFGDPYRDDNLDGYSDVLGEPLYDLDGDGVYDTYGDILADNNNDGYSDVTGYRLLDSDEDGFYDSLEIIERFLEDDISYDEEEINPADLVDENNDGISDTLRLPLIDIDRDGVYDIAGYAFQDADGDGVSDLLYAPLIDVDGDGVYDEIGPALVDDNGDGYSDISGQYLYDSDGDGQPDQLLDPLTDEDYDGISDVNGFPLVDLDNDGSYDTYDSGLQATEWQQGFLHKFFYEDGIGYLGIYRLGIVGLQFQAQQSIDPISTELILNQFLQAEEPNQAGIYLKRITGLDGEAQLRADLKLENHSFTFDLLSYYDSQQNKIKFKDETNSFNKQHTQHATYFTLGGQWQFLSITNAHNKFSLQLSYYQNRADTSFNDILPFQSWNWRYDREIFNIEQLFVRASNQTILPLGRNLKLILTAEQRIDSSDSQNYYDYNAELYHSAINFLNLPAYKNKVLWHYSSVNALADFSFQKVQMKLGGGGVVIHDFQKLTFYPQAEIESWGSITPDFSIGARAAWTHVDYDAAEYNRIKLWENGQNVVSSPPSNTDWQNLPQGLTSDAYAKLNIKDNALLLLKGYFGYYLYKQSYFPFATSLRNPDAYGDQLAATVSKTIDNQMAFGASFSFETNADQPLFASLNYTLGWSLIQLANQQEWVSADNDVRHNVNYILGYRFTVKQDWQAIFAVQGSISLDHPYDPIQVVADNAVSRGGDLDRGNDLQALSQLGERFNGQRSYIPHYSLFLRFTLEHNYINEKRRGKIKFFLQSNDLLALLQLQDLDVKENRIGSNTRLNVDRLVSLQPFNPQSIFALRFGASWEF